MEVKGGGGKKTKASLLESHSQLIEREYVSFKSLSATIEGAA